MSSIREEIDPERKLPPDHHILTDVEREAGVLPTFGQVRYLARRAGLTPADYLEECKITNRRRLADDLATLVHLREDLAAFTRGRPPPNVLQRYLQFRRKLYIRIRNMYGVQKAAGWVRREGTKLTLLKAKPPINFVRRNWRCTYCNRDNPDY